MRVLSICECEYVLKIQISDSYLILEGTFGARSEIVNSKKL